jgi:pimeloyl-ACP methyl ester carboxylesterase
VKSGVYKSDGASNTKNINKVFVFISFLSWHEMGIYDLPAMIDYVLNRTGQRNLRYVGFSMGTTMFFVLTSMKPEYNTRIQLMVALAPVTFMANSTTLLHKFNLSNKVREWTVVF